MKEIEMYTGVCEPTKADTGQPEEVVQEAVSVILQGLKHGRQVRVAVYVLKPEKEALSIDEPKKTEDNKIKGN